MKRDGVTDKIWNKVVELTGCVTDEAFIPGVYELLSHAADIAHYAVHTYDVSHLDEPRLVLCGGHISDYWAHLATRQAEVYSKSVNQISDATLQSLTNSAIEPTGLYRFVPNSTSQPDIARLYGESDLLEKIYDLRINGRIIYQLNLYRSTAKGYFTPEEIHYLELIVPLVTNLICLRFQICGLDNKQKQNPKYIISFLRENGTACFKLLTGQETTVCDLIVYGLTTEGMAAEMQISVSSVKTYRNRAYRKLNIHSKSELFAMIINRHMP